MKPLSHYTLKKSLSAILLVFLFVSGSALCARLVVESGANTAGFSFSTDGKNNQNTNDGSAVELIEPIVFYQQHIHMLSSVNDRPSVQIFGNGRVLVHYPVYMKKAGDYEMQLAEAELLDLIASFASNGLMDFDETKVKAKVKADEAVFKAQGQLFAISDAVGTSVDIKLDEYQANSFSAKQRNVHKQFRWENIEHDAVRYKQNQALIKANNSISQLRQLMRDARLVSRLTNGQQR